MKYSILIRTRNEAKWLPVLFERLAMQTERDFEVIVVDSGSTDNTVEIARAHGAHVIEIAPAIFTLPHSLNIAAAAAKTENYLVLLSAHSLPMGKDWLASAAPHFNDEKLAGVYGPVFPLPHATIADHFFLGCGRLVNVFKRPGIFVESKAQYGTLGFTNAVIRKDLWNQHHFNEAYAGGGEDTEWAAHFMALGYHVVYDRALSAQHSHNLSVFGWLKQLAYWRRTSAAPTTFEQLTFRKDGAYKPLTK